MVVWRLTRSRPEKVVATMISILLCALVISIAAGPAAMAQGGDTALLMFEERGCPWCRKWHQDVGPAYPNSPEGRRAPLRILDIHRALPPEIQLKLPVRASPTFVLVHHNREVGRIVGYPGDAFFWALLGELIAKLPSDVRSFPDVRPISIEGSTLRSLETSVGPK